MKIMRNCDRSTDLWQREPSTSTENMPPEILTIAGGLHFGHKAEQSLQKEMDSMEKDAYNGVKTLRKVLSVGQI